MSLQNLLDLSSSRNAIKQGISEERLRACMPELRKAIAFYRKYPDIFVDDIKGPDCIFKFYTYQRVFLRIVMLDIKWGICILSMIYTHTK